MKRYFWIAIAIAIAFLCGWVLGPGFDTRALRSVAPIVLTDQDGHRLGTLPTGTRVMSNFSLAPDVGLEGCVPVSFGDSLRAAKLFDVSGRVYTGVFVYEDRTQKVWIRGVSGMAER